LVDAPAAEDEKLQSYIVIVAHGAAPFPLLTTWV
jgi:hypothetical protein